MSYQGFIFSYSQIIRKNVTQLVFQGRLSDGRRFHWTVTRPGLVFFIDRDKTWAPPGAFRKSVKMNYPVASHGVSINDNIYPNAASCGEFNPTDFATSIAHSL